MKLVNSDDDDSVVEVVEGDFEPSYPHLVVAPSSVISNWVREFETFAPHLNVVKFHGSMNERMEIQTKLREFLPGGRKLKEGDTLDVILVPLTYFEKENANARIFLRKFKYDYMVVDEAHLLKNARGMRYQSLDKFATLHRLLLTVSLFETKYQRRIIRL